MKRAIGLIAATLLTASVYSQDYSGSSNSTTTNPDSTPDYQSRQSEAGAPANSESSSSSSAGYDRAPGLSGGNSSTGQSNGANIGSASDQDQSLTTRDSDLSGSEYRGTVQTEPEGIVNSELSENTQPLRGSGTADGAFHDPASPVREGSQSEGWSSSGTFSGAGPGSVSGSASSNSSDSALPAPTESSTSFGADVSNNSALNNRDEDLSNRGLEPDSDQLSRTDALSNRVEGDMDNDETMIFEDWTVITPDAESNVGAPAESEIGVGSSANIDSHDRFDSSVSGPGSSDSYSDDLYQRVQRDWSARTGTTDLPATPLLDKSLEELGDTRYDDSARQSDVGAPGASVSGSGKSEGAECDEHKGSAPDYQKGDESSSKYHINRGDDEKYHINREGSGDQSNADTRAPGEYGDRPERSSDYDDGHLSGNNAAGNSGSSESSSSKSSDESSRSTDGALTQPDL